MVKELFTVTTPPVEASTEKEEKSKEMDLNGEHEPGREELEERRRRLRAKRRPRKETPPGESSWDTTEEKKEERHYVDLGKSMVQGMHEEATKYKQLNAAEQAAQDAATEENIAKSIRQMQDVNREFSKFNEQSEGPKRAPITIGAPVDQTPLLPWRPYVLVAVGSFVGGLLVGLWLKKKLG